MAHAVTTRFVHNGSDCNWLTNAQQMLAWGLLNENALELTEQEGYVPLPFYFKRLVMVVFGISFCNGQQTFSKKVIIGRGEVFNIGQIWVQAYPFDLNFQMTYYSGGDQDLMKNHQLRNHGRASLGANPKLRRV